jgi:hypothetical protein
VNEGKTFGPMGQVGRKERQLIPSDRIYTFINDYYDAMQPYRVVK